MHMEQADNNATKIYSVVCILLIRFELVREWPLATFCNSYRAPKGITFFFIFQ